MKLLKMIFQGITWGCTICMIILVCIAAVNKVTFSMDSMLFIKHAIGSMIVGMGFTVPSLIYDKKNLGILLQTLIHMGCGFGIYLPIACYLGWIPVSLGWQMVILPLTCALVFSFSIWYGFFLYYKHEAKKINEKLTNHR